MAENKKFDDFFSGIDSVVPPKLQGESSIKNKKTAGSKKIEAPLGEPLFERQFEKGLIKRLEVRSWGTRFDFYDDFLGYALHYKDYYYPEADYISFFSFTPQYSGMTPRQIKYYSKFRHELKEGNFINADFSYVLLYIYEILNLPTEHMPPKMGAKYLGMIWRGYRERYPQLDKYLSEWLPDYCLLNSVECPFEEIEGFLNEVLKRTSFPEFFLNNTDIFKAQAAMIRSSSDYDFTKNKYVNPENKEIFLNHIDRVLMKCFEDKYKNGVSATPTEVIRDSYVGALCMCENKRRMTVTYIKLGRDAEGAGDVTEAIKYAEEMVKSGLGIRQSRSKAEPKKEVKNSIDEYFSGELSEFDHQSGRLSELRDRQYEPLDKGFSPEKASLIEEESREVAEMVEGEELKKEYAEEKAMLEKTEISEKTEKNGEFENTEPEKSSDISLDPVYLSALEYIYNGDIQGFKSYSLENSLMPEAIIEEINYFAFTELGDIAIEGEDEDMHIIEDYREDVRKWLKK